MPHNIEYFPKDNDVLSFWDISEKFIKPFKSRQPFRHICNLMRKNKVKSVAVQREINKESYFKKKYFHLKTYLNEIRSIAELKDVIQVSFLSCSVNSIRKKKFPWGIKKEHVLGVCVIVKLSLKANVGLWNKGENMAFVYEAIIGLPELQIRQEETSGLLSNYYHVFSNMTPASKVVTVKEVL